MCIIQDSVADWKKESATMGEIYKKSLCNIAATAAKNGRAGNFLKRNPFLAQPCRVKLKLPFRARLS
jgi:hypothetical protein